MLNAHNVLQRGAQSAFGTANATATAKLQNVSSFALNPDLQTRALDQLRGTLAPTHQTTLDHYASAATFEVSDESYEDVNYWLDSLFSAVASPGGTLGAYTRAYAAPTTAAAAPKFMTLQWGQMNEVWQMQDASVTTLTLSGSNNTGVQVGGSLIGGKVTAGTLATLSDRTTTRISGCQASVSIGGWSDTTLTALASSAFAWELTINANRQYRAYLGECTPSAWNDQKWNGQLRLSVELNDTTDDQLIAMFAASNAILERQIQIKYTNGSLVFQIQFAGHTMQAPQLFQDKNGVMTYDLVLDGVYNSTLANWLKINTTSAIDALV